MNEKDLIGKAMDVTADWLIETFKNDMKSEVYQSVPKSYPPEVLRVIDNVIGICAWQASITFVQLQDKLDEAQK